MYEVTLSNGATGQFEASSEEEATALAQAALVKIAEDMDVDPSLAPDITSIELT